MAKQTETKEIAVKTANLPSEEFKNMFDSSLGAGAAENIDNEDILIPKIHLAQALTPQVTAKELEAGVYMNSIDKSEIGSEVEVYVMQKAKLLQVYVMVPKGKNKVERTYLGTVPYNKADYIRLGEGVAPAELLPRAEKLGIELSGKSLEADKVLRFFVVKADEVASGCAFPYIVDFKRTSYNAGQELETKFARMRTMGLPSYAKVFSIGSELVSGEHDYFVKKVRTGRDITKDELMGVENWVRELRSNADRYAADESADEAETIVKDVTNKEDDVNQPKF